MPQTDSRSKLVLATIPNWIRWVLLLPGAFLTLLFTEGLIFFVIKQFASMHPYGDDNPDEPTSPLAIKIARIVAALAGSILYVQVTHAVAPSHKKITTLILTVILLIYSAGNLIQDYDLLEKGVFIPFVIDIVQCIGGIIGFFSLKKEMDK